MDIYHLLASRDWRRRQQAVEALAQMPDAELAQALVGIVRENHEDLSALNAALQVLARMGRAPLNDLLELLNSSDEDVRIYAPQILGQLGDERAVVALIDVLVDSNENVRFNAVEALGDIKARAAVNPLIRLLERDNLFVQYAAVLALGKIGAAQSPVVPGAEAPVEDGEVWAMGQLIADVLMPLLSDPYLAEPVVSALGDLGWVDAVPVIFDWLEQPTGDPLVALAALAQIVRHHPGAPFDRPAKPETPTGGREGLVRLVRAVEEILDGGEMQVHAERVPGEAKTEAMLADAGLVIGRLYQADPTDPQRRRLLVRLLAVPSARQGAEAALRSVSPPAPPELIAALSGDDLEVACTAAHILAALRDPQALDPLIEALEAEQRILSAHAAQALGEMDLPQAIEALLAHLVTPDLHVRQAVMNALSRHASPALSDRLVGLLDSENAYLREAALRILVEGQDARAANAAVAALADREISVRKAAVEVLPRTGSHQTVSLLEEVLHDPDPVLRASVARALAFLPPRQALSLLSLAVEDTDGWVRMHACRSLGKLGHPESLPWLLARLNDELTPVRLAALEALAQMDAPLARQQILLHLPHLLEDADAEVRMAARRYSEQVGFSNAG